MISKKELLKNWKIYPVLVDSLFPDRRGLTGKFRELLDSDIDAVQLRFKDITDASIYRLAAEMVATARRRKVAVLINDRPEAALALGADGVHLGKADVPPHVARKMLGPGAIIGRTTRGIADLVPEARKYIDYASVGPVFATPTKPGLKALPRVRVREMAREAGLPVVAIGGINADNAGGIAAIGIKTVAFVRYAVTERNTAAKIRKLRKILETRERA